ncbi:hypothetical protein L3Y34_019727 [Caenorhabditis briggsae]|uniref:Uncharacterized protein n=1 Tax=Caenorhabditis briggsae TaxID=6238 RepID=A0AAE9IWB9_CAEBR|nr:hypothetical protein L3Y34_019727 [Caenorhabditis briggsae]
MLHYSLLLALFGCALASFNSLGYRTIPTVPIGQDGQNKTIIIFRNGQRIRINCAVCRLCCYGKNMQVQVVPGPGSPAPPSPPFTIPGQIPPRPWGPGTNIPPKQNVPGVPGPDVPEGNTPGFPPAPLGNQYYPLPPVPGYATAPPTTTVPPPPPCVPTTTTEAPTTTTTSTTTPRPPCIYTAPPTQPTQPTLPTTLPPPATYPTVPTNGYATSPTPSGYPTAPPPTQTTVIPVYPVPEWPTTAQPIPTITPKDGEVPPGPNGECCFIDLRAIQATISCGISTGSQQGCCSKTCSSTSQIQRQIQINYQLLARIFGLIPSRITCSDAVRFGIVESREVQGVCQYIPLPSTLPPAPRPSETTSWTFSTYSTEPWTTGTTKKDVRTTPFPAYPVPTGHPGFTVPSPGAYVVPPSKSSSAPLSIVTSFLTIVLATVLCF